MLWVAVSNFDGVKTINEAYAAGATTFLPKPLDAMYVRNLVNAFEEYWTLKKTKTDIGVEAKSKTALRRKANPLIDQLAGNELPPGL